jgi:hypothetical protein
LDNSNLIDVIEHVLDKRLAMVHTNLVCRVEAVGATTIDVKPVVKRIINGAEVESPLFKGVPPVFMQGGGSYDSFPIAVGDDCLVIVSESCLDKWYFGEYDVAPNEDRHFDYSDAVAIVGLNQSQSAIPIPSVATSVGDKEITGEYTHTGDIIINGVSLWDFIQFHNHGGVMAGGSNTAVPNPL